MTKNIHKTVDKIYKTVKQYHEMNLPHPDFEVYLWACRISEVSEKMKDAQNRFNFYAAQHKAILKRMKNR